MIDQKVIIPLRSKIESKLGLMLVVKKEKEDMCFLYLSELERFGTGPIVSYDLYAKTFSFESKKYTEKQFERVLDLLAFI
jgi:hypothetical protein